MKLINKGNHRKKISDNITGDSSCLNIDQLWAYAKDKLNQKEKYEIEKHLTGCAICSQALEGLSDYPEEEFRAAIEKFHNHLDSTYPASQKGHTIRWIYAAAAILVISFLGLFYNKYFKQKPDNLFNQYFEPYPSTLRIVRGDTTSSALKSAMACYQKKEYLKALDGLQKLLEKHPTNPLPRFYTGMSYLCLNNPKQALFHFNKILKMEKHNFKDPALWYSSLSYIKLNHYTKARSILKQLSDSQNEFTEQSNKLLQYIE